MIFRFTTSIKHDDIMIVTFKVEKEKFKFQIHYRQEMIDAWKYSRNLIRQIIFWTNIVFWIQNTLLHFR